MNTALPNLQIFRRPLVFLLLGLMCPGIAGGMLAADPPFSSGSTGAYGAMEITQNTALDLPPDGIFHCTTITVAQGATLSFNKNALNTPVYLLATGDVHIAGTIDVSAGWGAQGLAGEGGPGGFDGGSPAMNFETTPGDGMGPGGGRFGPANNAGPDGVGGGGYATQADGWSPNHAGGRYGNSLLMPLIGGSGGGGAFGNPGIGGGGGGGAILISSSSQIQITGNVFANGGGTTAGNFGGGLGGGSGGAVRLVTPHLFGTGLITAEPIHPASAGFGRIRVDSLDRSGWNFNFRGSLTYGKRMQVFPSVVPRLDILEAAGQAIAEGTGTGVSIQLPAGSPSEQTVKVQVRNFTNDVPIRIVVTPESGPATHYDTNIVMSANPSSVVVPVVIPAGGTSRIHAWTR